MPELRRQKKIRDTISYLEIQVDRYEVSAGASVNPHAYAPELAWRLDDDDPLYKFTTQITIIGPVIYPKNRAGEVFEFTIVGTDSRHLRLSTTLKDVHKRDQRNVPQYRAYRGREVPVYSPPIGLAPLIKVRGERRWTAWLFVQPHFATDVMLLLGHNRDLYLSVHEERHERQRWLRHWTLQTNAPDGE